MIIQINLNSEQLDRLNSVMQQYNITHEDAILMLINTQPKESSLPRPNCRVCQFFNQGLCHNEDSVHFGDNISPNNFCEKLLLI